MKYNRCRFFIKVVSPFFLMVLLCYSQKVHAQSISSSKMSSISVINLKVDSLIKRMSLKEKIGQLSILGGDHKDLNSYVKKGQLGGTNGVLPGQDVYHYTLKMQKMAMQSPLKIPMLFMGDVIHGFRTIFPVPLAMACSWNPSLIRQADSVAAVEATNAGVNWTFTPMVDIARDPRWGRVVEGAGEDPYLGSKIAAAAVMGFQQGNLKSPHTMLATAKHFVGYGDVQAGRDYNTVDMSMHTLHQIYLPPFHAAVKHGVGAIMPAFVSFNGIPVTDNNFLLRDILRKKWGFNRVLVSDYDAIPELQQHGVAADPKDATDLAFKAGVDIDLHSGTYFKELPKLVKKGVVSEASIDSAVKRVLIMKYRLGLFNNPFQYGDSTAALAAQKELPADHRRFSLEAARQSIVLLKNDKQVLPLSKKIHSIAVIGPLADDNIDLLGPVHALGEAKDVVTLLQGIKDKVGSSVKINYARGTDIESQSKDNFKKAVEAADKSDVVIMALGESAGMSGEGDSRSKLGLPGNQQDLVKAVMKTGKPVVVVLMNGRPMTINWLHDNVPAILETWFDGTEAGPAIADVLFGDYNPSGKLPITFPRDVGQIPIFYDHLNTGRPFKKGDKYTSRYIDVPNSPLYPFGFGLSYTTFTYSDMHLNKTRMGWNDTLQVSVNVHNTGKRTGTEVVECYIRDLVASLSRPVKELKEFNRVQLKPGEKKKVTFRLTRHDLAFYRKNMRIGAEPGAFNVYVGGSSDSVKSASFILLKGYQ
jgi:beta-glucosidase